MCQTDRGSLAPRVQATLPRPLGRALHTAFRGQAGNAKEWVGWEEPLPAPVRAAATQLQLPAWAMWSNFQRVPQGPASPNYLIFQEKIII